jgi:hypothetical protein
MIARRESHDPLCIALGCATGHPFDVLYYNDVGNVIETHEHAGDFKEW